MTWLNPIPYKLIVTNESESFKNMAINETGLPVSPHPGSFGFERKNHTHEGVDLYCPTGTPVMVVEDGLIIKIEPFTGSIADPPSPWWGDTWAVMVEGETGVVVYGELVPDPALVVGNNIKAGEMIGNVVPVLIKDKGRPLSMLHIELHEKGSREFIEWVPGSEKPHHLLDPTNYLINCKN